MQANIQAWLDEQCRQINGATGAVVLVLPRNSTSLVPAAHWPPGGLPGEGLAAAAKAAYEQRQPLSQPRLNGAERPIPLGPMISCPIEVKGRTVGAVAVGFDPDVTLPPQAVMDGIKRGAESFESYMRQSPTPRKTAGASTAALGSAGFVPNDMTRTQPGPMEESNAVDPTRTQPGPMVIAAAPAPSSASGQIPTLRNEVGDRTVELPSSNSARILQLLATVEAHERFTEPPLHSQPSWRSRLAVNASASVCPVAVTSRSKRCRTPRSSVPIRAYCATSAPPWKRPSGRARP